MTKTVLIADDDRVLRLIVGAVLTSDEYTVLAAEDGDEAWRSILDHRPTLALLDVQMPGRSGLQLTAAIKNDPELAGTHVVLLTSKTQETDIRAGLAAGADCYLTKPFSPLELLTVVERALAAAEPENSTARAS